MRNILKIQQLENMLLVHVDVNGGTNLTHIEYYIGVKETHPLYTNIEFCNNIDILRNHPVYKGAFNKDNTQFTGELLSKLNETLELIGKSESELQRYVSNNGLKSIDYAWLSYIGHSYEYLDDDLCYFGGGMYVPHFGENDCYIGSIAQLERMRKYLKGVC